MKLENKKREKWLQTIGLSICIFGLFLVFISLIHCNGDCAKGDTSCIELQNKKKDQKGISEDLTFIVGLNFLNNSAPPSSSSSSSSSDSGTTTTSSSSTCNTSGIASGCSASLPYTCSNSLNCYSSLSSCRSVAPCGGSGNSTCNTSGISSGCSASLPYSCSASSQCYPSYLQCRSETICGR
ncbi:MAG: hypothetical protein SFU98_07240 [Leptospiraceae bacterium]|nr:hypothetical protein [Leptospiraceae bacterium]